MTVVRGKVGPRLKIADDRHVDQKAEYAGTGKVPKANRHQKIERPSMTQRLSGLAARHCDEISSIESEQGQRYDLERREGCRECHVELGLAGEVPVMPGADEAAAKDQNDVKIDNPQCGRAPHQSKPMEDDRDNDRDEQLKETFDPEMDDPEAPGIRHGVVGRSIKKQSR